MSLTPSYPLPDSLSLLSNIIKEVHWISDLLQEASAAVPAARWVMVGVCLVVILQISWDIYWKFMGVEAGDSDLPRA